MYIPLLQSLGTSNPASSSSFARSSNASSPSGDGTGGLNTMFLQLLTAQLKSQTPMNPLDPNQFAAQLAQFQSLSTLNEIDQLMQILVYNTSATSSGKAQSAGVANAGAIPSASPNSSSH